MEDYGFKTLLKLLPNLQPPKNVLIHLVSKSRALSTAHHTQRWLAPTASLTVLPPLFLQVTDFQPQWPLFIIPTPHACLHFKLLHSTSAWKGVSQNFALRAPPQPLSLCSKVTPTAVIASLFITLPYFLLSTHGYFAYAIVYQNVGARICLPSSSCMSVRVPVSSRLERV